MTEGVVLIEPQWPAPDSIRAAVTTRRGGISTGCWQGLNLGTHVGDEYAAVVANRQTIRESLSLPSEPIWLNQVHGTQVVEVTAETDHLPTADASISRHAGTVCAVMTADCLPLLLCDQQGKEWAAVHCGWRGLCDGLVQKAVSRFKAAPEQLLAWMGPAIGQASFQVVKKSVMHSLQPHLLWQFPISCHKLSLKTHLHPIVILPTFIQLLTRF